MPGLLEVVQRSVAAQRFDAGEVVDEAEVSGMSLQALEQQRLRLVVALRLLCRDAREGELPR
jgi:hypothetical protein